MSFGCYIYLYNEVQMAKAQFGGAVFLVKCISYGKRLLSYAYFPVSL